MRWRPSRAGIEGGRPRPPAVAVVDCVVPVQVAIAVAVNEHADVKVYLNVDVAGTPFHTSRGMTLGPERRTPLSRPVTRIV